MRRIKLGWSRACAVARSQIGLVLDWSVACNQDSFFYRLFGAAVQRYEGTAETGLVLCLIARSKVKQDLYLVGRKRSGCDRSLEIETCSLINRLVGKES